MSLENDDVSFELMCLNIARLNVHQLSTTVGDRADNFRPQEDIKELLVDVFVSGIKVGYINAFSHSTGKKDL